MTKTIAQQLTHPAHAALLQAAADERRNLAQALAIEADWRFHDGPEWAARYWAAFGDLRRDAQTDHDMRVAASAAPRQNWPTLAPVESEQARAIFRALLAALHPAVAPKSAAADTTGLWELAVTAYRAGDAARLRDLLRRARRNAASARLPADIVELRHESNRLRAAREQVDRRLAALSQQFPFCLREKLVDPQWVRRQRMSLRQVIAMAAPPRSRPAATAREQVS